MISPKLNNNNHYYNDNNDNNNANNNDNYSNDYNDNSNNYNYITFSKSFSWWLFFVNLLTPKISLSNSPYYLPYNSYDVNLENLLLDQLIIP